MTSKFRYHKFRDCLCAPHIKNYCVFVSVCAPNIKIIFVSVCAPNLKIIFVSVCAPNLKIIFVSVCAPNVKIIFVSVCAPNVKIIILRSVSAVSEISYTACFKIYNIELCFQ